MVYSYNEIYELLSRMNYTIKNGQPIIIDDIKNAVRSMQKKHSACEWKSDYYFPQPTVEYDGVLWIEFVFFNYSKTKEDCDVQFFEQLIEAYKSACEKHKIYFVVMELVDKDMTTEYFAHNVAKEKISKIKKALEQIPRYYQEQTYEINYAITQHNKGEYDLPAPEIKEIIIKKETLEYLITHKFKNVYLEYLEGLYIYFRELCLQNGIYADYEIMRIK